MQGNQRVVQALNDLLILELTAINQYVAHSKMCENWGYDRLAGRFRQTALEEMKDAEGIIDRILFLEGQPNMQDLGSVPVGGTVADQLRLALDTERRAVGLLGDGIATALEVGDQATREFFAGGLPEEEGHIDWLETQLGLIDQIGETNYLAQQLRE